MTINSRKRGTTPKLLVSEASLPHKEEEKHRDPHHVPGHGTPLLGTTLKLASFSRAGFLASSKSKLGLRFRLALHLPISQWQGSRKGMVSISEQPKGRRVPWSLLGTWEPLEIGQWAGEQQPLTPYVTEEKTNRKWLLMGSPRPSSCRNGARLGLVCSSI